MMLTRRKFLVVDDNADSRFLLVKTLLRKFPDAVLQECQSSLPAIDLAQSGDVSAVVVHRAMDADGETLIKLIRRVNAEVPIVMVSGFDRSQVALAMGANCFLNYDAWLRIGTVVADLIAASPRPAPETTGTASEGAGQGTSPGSTPSVPTRLAT